MPLAVAVLVTAVVFGFREAESDTTRLIDMLGIPVELSENRQFSYTDKQAAYYYGRTHGNADDDWFYGWNVNRRRIFSDYSLSVDGKTLKRSQSIVTVYPHKLVRIYPNATEIFTMFDEQPVLCISLRDVDGEEVGLSIIGEELTPVGFEDGIAWYRFTSQQDLTVAVAPIIPVERPAQSSTGTTWLKADASCGGFFIAAVEDRAEAFSLIKKARESHGQWASSRKNRMERLIAHLNSFRSDNEMLNTAIPWIMLTLDQLITRQSGHGIYAGLPWFNDYWGRDMFISLSGACLVTGQFDVARKILLSFSEYQNTDRKSPHYGRVPNRLRPDDVIYNTTDGTPRYIIALLDYIKYSGDISLISELYPVISRSIDGPLEYWVDDACYLTHDDADTWMDAKLEGSIPWSPRGNRANDIQALWHQQLVAGVFFAEFMKEPHDEERWQACIDCLRTNFRDDFFDTTKSQFMADRLRADGSPDFAVRPNQLFALDLIEDEPTRWRITRSIWNELVYPWGVASLSQYDANFHPYHEYWDYYHKDAAYHNGTVWIWNNGIAMQRMLEADQTEPAYELFENMSRLALEGGAVGSLCENMDALPRPGASWARRSGTFLQAWSNAEYLRVWYQCFLGIRPNATRNEVVLAPHMPEAMSACDYQVQLFDGNLTASYRKTGLQQRYVYVFTDAAPTVMFRLPAYGDVSIIVMQGDRVEITDTGDSLQIVLRDSNGMQKTEQTIMPDGERLERLSRVQEVFRGVTFARPYLQPNLRSLQTEQDAGDQ